MALLKSERIQDAIAKILMWIAAVFVAWLVARLFGVDVGALINQNAHKLFDLF